MSAVTVRGTASLAAKSSCEANCHRLYDLQLIERPLGEIYMRALVTGGAGFIGSALVRHLVREEHQVVNVDKLTYAGSKANVAEVADSPNYEFLHEDIVNASSVSAAFEHFKPDVVYHLAAESHVDRSIDRPSEFIQTNITGTFVMLEAALAYYRSLAAENSFKFVHVSTDEVYGSLGPSGYFVETTPYAPNSPYSASKASADHLCRAWSETFGLPVSISNCTNNYGPFQNKEKLIPTVIRRALCGEAIPIYGDGLNVRDWLYVDDHVRALCMIAEKGVRGEKYNIGGKNEIANIVIARSICQILDRLQPKESGEPYETQITYVTDRPGHDRRYAIDATKVERELGWTPVETFETGIEKTVAWYLERFDVNQLAAERLGLARA